MVSPTSLYDEEEGGGGFSSEAGSFRSIGSSSHHITSEEASTSSNHSGKDGGGTMTTSSAADLGDRQSSWRACCAIRCLVVAMLLALTCLIGVVFLGHGIQNTSDDDGTNNDISLWMGVVCLSLIVGLVLVLAVHDRQSQRREWNLVRSAQRSMAVVQSLFPSTVQDRILNADYNLSSRKLDIEHEKVHDGSHGGTESVNKKKKAKKGEFLAVDSNHSGHDDVDIATDNVMLTERTNISNIGTTTPIADYYPSTTILFGDIVGFTAWSSVREPSQVFQLLEALYGAFDVIAKKKGVFKVETIGDCYVAAAGLPTPREDHAVIMSSFARRCLDKMLNLVADLEISLGPGTADLGMRFGLHSGPTIGGVLRGAKARYQLYGDTMNTAARIESSSIKNKIHLSEQTADLLKAAGKGLWVEPREEKVEAKGKGVLQTYWLNCDPPKNLTKEEKLALPVFMKMLSIANIDPGFCPSKASSDRAGKAKDRLVDYSSKVLKGLLKKVFATRVGHDNLADMLDQTHGKRVVSRSMRRVVKDTNEDFILPTFDPQINYVKDPSKVELGDQVIEQLHDFVEKIASSYHDLPFHCFEHATHVLLSVTKLFALIETNGASGTASERGNIMEMMMMDPLTQFSVAFAALVHDVDYDVPNGQLAREGSDLVDLYGNKSVAEQHSIDLAWSLLMEPCFQELRGCIYQTEEEMERFRSLLSHSIMATDISSKEASTERRARWERTFVSTTVDKWEEAKLPEELVATRKALVVIEHIIQLSDVSHTLQHMNVFAKWNKLLFKEQYLAFKSGRAAQDPSVGWYRNEIGFFDHHILPLATRFQEFKLFGVGSEEYLKNAVSNRREWEYRGMSMVEGYLEEFAVKTAVAAGIEKSVKRIPSVVVSPY